MTTKRKFADLIYGVPNIAGVSRTGLRQGKRCLKFEALYDAHVEPSRRHETGFRAGLTNLSSNCGAGAHKKCSKKCYPVKGAGPEVCECPCHL